MIFWGQIPILYCGKKKGNRPIFSFELIAIIIIKCFEVGKNHKNMHFLSSE